MDIIRIIRTGLRKIFSCEVYYVNGADTLPPPLTKEEETAVFLRLTNNDVDARKTLIVHNLRLVVYIAKKFESTGIGIEDLVSIGTIGLIKAVNTFCPTKNIKLATYASRCIENELHLRPMGLYDRAQHVHRLRAPPSGRPVDRRAA